VRLAEAPSYGRPIVEHDPTSRGAVAYQALADELRRRDGRPVSGPVPVPEAVTL
jgi:chromosome partitioning protein